MGNSFKAVLVEKNDDQVSSSLKDVDINDLPEGDVTVDIEYSSLNYKDGMVMAGIGNLVRNYPHIPGVDFSGTVLDSAHDDYKPGDKVVLTGWRVGEAHWGGFAERARVKADWLVPLPAGLSTRDAMAVGTAGLTSMLCVEALENHGITPDAGDILVTGAAGGVGSVAVAILAKLGYRVVASTGRAETHDFLKSMGAAEIIDRAELSEETPKPLEKERWAGAVDTVGGTTLARLLGQVKYGGSVAACGVAGGPKLSMTVFPFILRGVNLLGVESVIVPKDHRQRVWDRIKTDLPMDKLTAITTEASLADLPGLGADILKGQVRGRTVVKIA